MKHFIIDKYVKTTLTLIIMSGIILEVVVVASALDDLYDESCLAVVSRSLIQTFVKSQYGGRPHVVSYNIIIFFTQHGYFTISDGIFKFNFLALVVSEIIGGPKFTLWSPEPPDIP